MPSVRRFWKVISDTHHDIKFTYCIFIHHIHIYKQSFTILTQLIDMEYSAYTLEKKGSRFHIIETHIIHPLHTTYDYWIVDINIDMRVEQPDWRYRSRS